MVGLVVLAPFVAFSLYEASAEQLDIAADLRVHGRNAAQAQWNASMRESIGTVLQIQNFWANSEYVSEAEFHRFVGSAREGSPLIADFHVLNETLAVEWSEPSLLAEGKQLTSNATWAFLHESRWGDDPRPVLAYLPTLTNGATGLAIAAPLRLENEATFTKVLVAEIASSAILDHIYSPSLVEDFHLTLVHEGNQFEAGSAAALRGPHLEVQLGPFPSGVRALTMPPVVIIRPTEPYFNSQQSNVAEYSAIAGLVVATGATWMSSSMFRRRDAHAVVQARVRESETHYRELFENAGEAILVIGKGGAIVDVNPQGQQLLGRPEPSRTPLSLAMLCSPADLGDLERRVEAVRASGETEAFAGRLLARGGTPVDVYGALSLAKGEAAEPTVIACLVDVTRLRQLETELRRANQRLASKVGELDLFAHTVAHDLRSPLRAITVFADDLVEDNQERLSPEGREQLAHIHTNVDHMRAMLDALLQYAKAGGEIDEKQLVHTRDLIEQVRDEIAPLLASSKATLLVTTALPDVVARPIPLKQVFTNLIVNAIKHNDHPHPKVRVAAEPDPEGGWAFTVSDNGPGIPDPEKDRVFALFARSATRSEGSGVGLAIVRRIVESHGGVIGVGDSADGGATFRFTLPDSQRPFAQVPAS